MLNRVTPSHGWGRRFNPYIAHHLGAAGDTLHFKGFGASPPYKFRCSAPPLSGTIRRTSAEHGTAIRGKRVDCVPEAF